MLYLLRHEERHSLPIFYIELTEKGKQNAIKLTDRT